VQLKRGMSAEEIRDNLSTNEGVGFFFSATSWKSLGQFLDNAGPKSKMLEDFLWNLGPFIDSPIRIDNKIVGANIIWPLPVPLWLGSKKAIRRFRESHYIAGLKLAEKCGIRMVSLGAAIPYLSSYGKLDKGGSNVGITVGHTASVYFLRQILIKVVNHLSLKLDRVKIAIFGAAGTIGWILSNEIAKLRPNHLILIDLKKTKGSLNRLTADILGKGFSSLSNHIFTDSASLPDFDGAVIVSTSSVPYLTEEALLKSFFWIDDSHPRSVSLEAERSTKGKTLYLECYARGPDGFDAGFPFELPSKQDTYACFTEGWLAWKEGHVGDFYTGSADSSSIDKMSPEILKCGFSVGPLIGKDGHMLLE
jgi:predicted amino acid dehydrogenase